MNKIAIILSCFGLLTTLSFSAANDNVSRANAKFIGTNTDKYYSTLRGFIIASLSVQLRGKQ